MSKQLKEMRGRMKILLPLATAVLMVAFVFGYTTMPAAGQSSCVTCHLDQVMLEDTAAPVKGGGSPLQSGAG